MASDTLSQMRVLLILAFLLGCTTTVAPTNAPPTNSLEIGNGTTIAVTLLVNGKVLGVFPPGAAGVIPTSELPLSHGRSRHGHRAVAFSRR